MKAKFTIGDKVRIVNYGAEGWSNKPFGLVMEEKDGMYHCDAMPELVGERGEITRVEKIQDLWFQYALKGPNKTAWYFEDQLELIVSRPKLMTQIAGDLIRNYPLFKTDESERINFIISLAGIYAKHRITADELNYLINDLL